MMCILMCYYGAFKPTGEDGNHGVHRGGERSYHSPHRVCLRAHAPYVSLRVERAFRSYGK